MSKEISRRDFVRTGMMGLAGTAVHGAAPALPQSRKRVKIREYRTLGRTGMKVSDIGLGAAYTRDPALVDYILDCGVNYIDTAERYSRGQNEAMLGQVARKRRGEFFLTTKLALRRTDTAESLVERFNACLSRLQTNHADVLMAHDSRDRELIAMPAFHTAFRRLKSENKVRFLGISEHDQNMADICNFAIDDGRFDVILMVYNFMQEKAADILKHAREKNVGTVIMKALAASHPVQMRSYSMEKRRELQKVTEEKTAQFRKEQKITEEQFPGAAIKWILRNRDVGTIILSMRNYKTADQYIAASGGPFSKGDSGTLERYSRVNAQRYCRHACGECEQFCPSGVAINDVLRIDTYFTNYREEKAALTRYAAIDSGRKPFPCAACPGDCERRCPYGLPVRGLLLSAHERLTL